MFERLGVLSNEGSTLVFPDDIAERNRAAIESGRRPEAEPRIAAAVIAAPAIAYLFDEQSIRAIETPTLLLIPEHDEVLPRAAHTDPMLAHWPQPERIVDVPVPSHYSFVAPIDEALLTEELEEVFRDPPGFDRRPFHREMNAQITAFFQKNL